MNRLDKLSMAIVVERVNHAKIKQKTDKKLKPGRKSLSESLEQSNDWELTEEESNVSRGKGRKGEQKKGK